MKKSLLLLLPVMLLAFSCARSKREGKKQHEKAETPSKIDIATNNFAGDPNACTQQFVDSYNVVIDAMTEYQANLTSPTSGNLLLNIIYKCSDFQELNNGYPSCLASVNNQVVQVNSQNELKTECQFYFDHYQNNAN